YLSAWEIAKANIPLSEAAVSQAQAAVLGAQAALDRATRNLSYCTIKSPVKGVIIDRRVNIGQTVVASLSAPSLFLIAKDLTRLQVWVAVNEMDIGNIRAGQPVTFTVDAFPNVTFRGEVNKVRLNATMTQNVVTYTVEVNTDNSDGKLLPYLTANLSFEVSRKADVLLVPNGAFRWVPQQAQIAPDARAAYAARRGQQDGSGGGRGPSTRLTTRSSTRPSRGGGSDFKPATLWVLDGTFVRPVNVRAGGTDGAMTEIRTMDLDVGATIVVGEDRRSTDASAGITNPFAQQMFRRPGGGSGGGGTGGTGGTGGPGGGGGGGGGSRQ
ncbi:MAG: efflux RND transporter periplasmic adaptor subunit, partial [Tepidisphaeraceae bacterium]